MARSWGNTDFYIWGREKLVTHLGMGYPLSSLVISLDCRPAGLSRAVLVQEQKRFLNNEITIGSSVLSARCSVNLGLPCDSSCALWLWLW